MPAASRHLVAVAAVASVRLALWVLPFPSVSAACARCRRVGASPSRRPGVVAGVVTAVHQAARLVPGATCLTQALAAQWMLGRAGITADLRFGAARGPSGLAAHAWLDVGGQTVIGDTPVQHTVLRTHGPRDVG